MIDNPSLTQSHGLVSAMHASIAKAVVLNACIDTFFIIRSTILPLAYASGRIVDLMIDNVSMALINCTVE